MALSISLSGIADLQAAPHDLSTFEAVAQNVDYISPESSAALDLGFPVLVPGWVPAPFGGPPAIDAGGGYYGLYWINVGGEPTFLHVTGQVGGGLPAGSPYDLNNELFINASVMGYDAIHDVTPAYDAVWWIAGGVLYKVESRNSGVDSLSLANSLVTFQGPSAPAPEPTVAPEPTTAPEPTAEPQPTFEPAPTLPPESEPTSPPVAEGPDDGSPTEAAQPPGESTPTVAEESATTEIGGGDPQDSSVLTGEVATDVPAEVSPSLTDSSLTTDGTGQPSVSSDGTGGPDIPAVDGDGTGGAADIYVPRRSTGIQTP
jgi:hypothetical protein